jgi:ERF superfamily protein
MQKSDNIEALAEALSQLQGEIRDVFKDKQAYGYKFGDLTQVLEIARPLLKAHGLSIIQMPGSTDDKVTLETMLMHKSGQWISGTLEMTVTVGKGMTPAQAVGSVITYARRYSLTSWLGISQSDNDAAIEHAPRITEAQISEIMSLVGGDQTRFDNIWPRIHVPNYKEADMETAQKVIETLKKQNLKGVDNG